MNWWIVIAVVLAAVLVGVIFYLISFSMAVKDINSQLRYINENETNKKVAVGTAPKSITNLTTTINSMLVENRSKELAVAKKDEELKETITAMAHDVRTPLTSLKGYFELMSESKNPDDIERYKGIITERIDSLSDMLEQLFTYTKINNTSYKLEMDKVDLSNCVISSLLSYYNDFEKRDFDVKIDIDENVHIAGDEQSLKRVVQNLIKNSLVHGEKTIGFSLKREADKAIFTVSNGFAEQNRPDVGKVFDRFYKGDKSRKVNSSGIGLSVVQKLVTLMNGEISAKIIDAEFQIVIIWKAI